MAGMPSPGGFWVPGAWSPPCPGFSGIGSCPSGLCPASKASINWVNRRTAFRSGRLGSLVGLLGAEQLSRLAHLAL